MLETGAYASIDPERTHANAFGALAVATAATLYQSESDEGW